MKKLLFLGLLSLASVAALPPSAQAWFHHLCCHHCNDCTTTIRVRPYNAFSPICCGTLDCVGCCPMNFGCGQQPRCGPSCFQSACCGPQSCFTSGCCDSGCLPPAGQPMPQTAPGQPMPQGVPGQQFTPPNPQPLNPGAFMMPMQNPMAYGYGYGPVQPVSYQQPMVNPYYYYNNQQQAPSYWYGR
jgi:hypothetical protein